MKRHSRKILIVDDEPYNILALRIIIKQVCHPDLQEIIDDLIDQAPNGQIAFEKVKQSHELYESSYGIIFMDCSMPIMNGFDATNCIRQYLR